MTETQNTPESDAFDKQSSETVPDDYGASHVWEHATRLANFARSLEKRLNAALAELAKANQVIVDVMSLSNEMAAKAEAELAQEKAKREEAEKERAAFMISANNLQATCDHQQVTINALLTRRNEMESSLATLRAEVKLRADSELSWLQKNHVWFAETLHGIGWTAPTDAQWSRLAEFLTLLPTLINAAKEAQ